MFNAELTNGSVRKKIGCPSAIPDEWDGETCRSADMIRGDPEGVNKANDWDRNNPTCTVVWEKGEN